jgi:SAM-dependent methyltransferase
MIDFGGNRLRERLGALRRRLRTSVYRLAPTRLYLFLYARDTDGRVDRDPARASGHPEAVMAPLVMRYIRHLGLQPRHRLLDFGCGTLRTGKHLIDFLEPDHYMGVDISRKAIEHSLGLIEANERIAKKRPILRAVSPFDDLDLPWTPDFILCHSVFTHLTRPAARRTFRQLRTAMGPQTTLALTAFCADTYDHAGYKDIRYPAPEIMALAAGAGIALRILEGEWGISQTIFFGMATDRRPGSAL